MDPSIWSRLPDDLLDRILALLPLKTLFALRPTCKRFNSLLFSPSFLSLLNSSPSSSSFLILSHPQFSHRFLPLYDSSTDHWRTIPLSSPTTHLLSSSSGLLLFSVGYSSLLVLNLLTNCSTIVRCPTNPISSATLTSSPSSSPHGYRIFVPCSNTNWVFVYSSANQSWSRFSGLESVMGHSNSRQNGILFHGSLLFSTPEPFSIVGFDPVTGVWDPRAGPELPAELAFVRLVNGRIGKGERLYLVGGVGRDGISRSLQIWELVSGNWEEVGRLPELMCRKFVSVCYHNYSHVYCFWHEGLVCVCCTTWPEVLFFKVGRGTWHWLQRCPLLQEKWSCGFRWFSFVPDLYALV